MLWRVVRYYFLPLLSLAFVPLPHADAEPVSWTYQGEIVTTGPSFTFGPKVLVAKDLTTYPNEQVQFADVSGTGTGSMSVPAFQMRIENTSSGPFSAAIHTFNLGFTVLDQASGASGVVTFHGTLDGVLSRNGHGSAFAQLQVGFTGQTTQSLVLGDHLYKLTIAPFNFQYSQALKGDEIVISPYQDVPISVQVSDVPEPSTLALAAAGLAAVGWRAWRRRKGLAAAV
jgi:hypothetical protein